MVEYWSPKPQVKGSSPFSPELNTKRPFRLVVRTSPFQGDNTGSIPVGDRITFDIKI